jgi:hypothetical protein
MGFELRKQIYLGKAAGLELRMDVMVREPKGKQKIDSENAPVKSG